MDALATALIDFVRVRQLNFAVAGLLTLVYIAYQYWGVVFKEKSGSLEDCSHGGRLARTHSRSRSRSRSKIRAGSYHDHKADKHARSRRYGRCPDCSKCNLDG